MISNVSSRFTTLLSFLILFNFASAQDSEIREDSLFYNLSEIEVSTNTKPKVPTLKNGDVIWSFDEIDKLPQIFGYADPIKYSQTLPGIQTNNEYDAGIHIYGCDNSHNYVGIEGVNSNLATAVRTMVVVVMAWVMVFVTDAQGGLGDISRRSWVFLTLSGLATGASWLCYYKALQMGDVSKVVPIDKLSVVFTLILAFLFLHEEFTLKSAIGTALLAAGTLVMVL